MAISFSVLLAILLAGSVAIAATAVAMFMATWGLFVYIYIEICIQSTVHFRARSARLI